MAIHERVWERSGGPESRRPGFGVRPFRPIATYWLMGIIAGVWILQILVLQVWGEARHGEAFVIARDAAERPWSLLTSTFSHDPYGVGHLLFNGLFLFFFGPSLERIWGPRRLALWFPVAGAISGILQVSLADGGALGASGALMMMFGVLVVLMPRQQILIWGLVPVPFWAAGVGYVAIDLLGAFTGGTGIGHFAHLSGLALGLVLGYQTKQDLARRGLVLASR